MARRKALNINGAECGAEALILGLTTALGGFLIGYDTGQLSNILQFKDFIDRFGNVDDDGTKGWQPTIQSLIVSFMSIGALIGALFGAYTSDWWGRRKSLSFGVSIFILGCVIQMTAWNTWVHFMVGRFVAGLGLGNLSVGIPMFQSECSPREIRGAVVASYQLMITMGILVSDLICYGARRLEHSTASWRVIIAICICCSMPVGMGLLKLPESPRWLASREDWEGARMSMARLRGFKHDPNHPIVEDDITEMRQILEKERQVGSGTWLECFRPNPNIPKLVYRTLLGISVHFLQQLTGVNYFFYYGTSIFTSAGIDDPILTQLILGAVNVCMSFYGLYIVEKYGRRWPLFLGALWQSIWLLVFATVGTLRPPELHKSSGIIMIVSACMFITSFAGTWGPMAWVVIGETFPLRTRAKQASLATAGNWLGNFLVGFFTPMASKELSYAYGYVFFVTNVVAAMIVWFYLYESRMLSLENVELMYGEEGLTPQTSDSWVPPRYLTRRQRDPRFSRHNSLAYPQGHFRLARRSIL